jgi:hypothetical protein
VASEESKEESKSKNSSALNKKIAFSYHISKPHSMEQLSKIMFEILILRFIKDEHSNQVFIFPKWISLFFEISNEMEQWF